MTIDEEYGPMGDDENGSGGVPVCKHEFIHDPITGNYWCHLCMLTVTPAEYATWQAGPDDIPF